MQFGILGSLRIVVDGREIALTSPRQRILLSALLVDVGWIVSTDRLAEVMWGDDQPDGPPGAVYTHVSRLRSLLQQHGGQEARRMLVTRPPGYVLAVEPGQVDAGRFERLVEEAQAAAAPQTTAELLEKALVLWRGRPLAEFDHESALVEAARLEELHTTAVELRADALLALGRYAPLAGELEAAVARHPFRERLRGQLMVALVRCGRQADALAAYRDLRDALVGELGLEPSAELRRLERAILQQDEELPWPAPAAGPRGRADPGRLREPSRAAVQALPEALTSFVGRDEDIRGVSAALAEARLVVLTGPGGVGKSRLAVRVAGEVADGYADGVDLCDLVGVDDSEAVPDVVATTLEAVPTDRADLQDALVATLRGQRRLVILDNCEHVSAGAAELADRITRGCPGVAVLATSRQPLGVPGQRIWPVRPLEVGPTLEGDAVALFRDRAAAVDPAFEVGDDREAVGEICRRLDGLPLAVELAAAWVRFMTPADIVDCLDDRFDLVTRDPGAASSRHRSLHAAVDRSYTLLPDATRRLFDRLAVFAGSFGLDAAEQVCAGDGLPAGEVADRLAELVDHSLVVVDRTGKRARYRVLETLRAYGHARLEARGGASSWHRRHAEHFTAVAEEAAARLKGPDEARWVEIVDTELANLRAAHAWACANGEVDLALHLAAHLRVYAYYRLRDEVYDWALRAVELPGASARAAYPAALLTAGVGQMQRGHLDRAREHAEQVLAAASDEAVVLRARRLLAEVALYEGRLEATDRWGREVIEQARGAGRRYDEALGHLYRVLAAAYAGRTEEARTLLEAGWQVVEAADQPTLRAGYHYLEGEVRLDDDPAAALRSFQEAIELARSVGNRFIEGVARVAAASLEARHGQPDGALAAFREIVDHWRASGDWAHMWTTLRNLLLLFQRIGADGQAAVLLGTVETATTGAPSFGVDAGRLARSADALRVTLGEEAFADAEARGRAMSDDEAVVYALEEIDRLLAN